MQRVDPLIGGIVANRFRIREKIAAGGFGAIYRAEHVASGNAVAIKVLHPQLAADPNVIARFRREGATLSKLRAPHTVTTYEFGEAGDGMLYIVMELLQGVSLHERLRERGMLPWREAMQIARAICISLAEAHALGIVHRDLKPANIHLEARGDTDYVKVLDFGIAKIKRGSSTDDQPELTNAGQMVGTIDYMAPEQILGGQPDGRSDIFTLGILLFEMIAGRRPFADSATPTSILAALLTQTPAKLSTFTPVPPALDDIVAKCLARELNDRFANVDELADEIDRVLMTSSDDGATRTIAIGIHTQNWADEEATLLADATMQSPALPARRVTLETPVPPVPPQSPSVITPRPQLAVPTPAPRPVPAHSTPPHPQPAHATPPHPQPAHPTAPRSQATHATPPPRSQPAHPTPAPRSQPAHSTPTPHPHTPTPFPSYPFAQPQQQPPPQQQQQPPPQQHQQPSWQPARHPTPPAAQPVINPSAWQGYGNAPPYLPPTAPPGGTQVDRTGPLTPGSLKSYDPDRDAAVGRIIWIVAILLVIGIGFAIYQLVS